MKAAFTEQYGPNDTVQVGERPMPELGPGQVRIQLRAASVNPIDYKTRDGDLKRMIPLQFPIILGSDGAGIVQSIGSDVTRVKAGDEVYFRCLKTATGTFAEYLCIDADLVALRPQNISMEESAAIPLVGLTSYQALIDKAGLKAGQKVLIHAGAGGIGSFAIQLAKSVGAHVATTASAKRVPYLESLGADQIIDYKTQKFEDELSRLDVVFDTLGGESQAKSFGVLKPGGVLISIVGIPDPASMKRFGAGFIARIVSTFVHWRIQRRAQKFGVRFIHHLMDASGPQLDTLRALVEEGKIRSHIDSVHTLDNVRDALARSESGRAQGKIIVRI